MKVSSKFILSAVALASAAFAQSSYADEGVAYNVGAISEYRYRGLGQTRGKPALQGGVDYDSGKGFYLGAWGSTIKWIKDQSTPTQDVKGSVELDLYGGYKFEAAGLGWDVGYLRYEYVGNKLEQAGGTGGKEGTNFKNANTDEIYGAVTAGAFTAKYSYALSNLFGNYNFTSNQGTKGSYYLDLSYTIDVGNGMTLVPHVGRQKIKHLESFTTANPSYTDFALTLNKDFGNGLSASVAAIGTNADKGFYTIAPTGSSVDYYQGKSRLVAGLKYTF
jgi:uncharacterized protein (TIGR02001 family)